MKARTKITLLTSGFAIIVAIGLLAAVCYELLEQPVRLIDRELFEIGEQLLDNFAEQPALQGETVPDFKRHPFDKYWIKVKTENGQTFRSAQFTSDFDITTREDERYYFTYLPVPLEKLILTKSDRDEIDDISTTGALFRVYHEHFALSGKKYQLLVARPIPVLSHELVELAGDALIALAICSVIVIIAGYYLSGTILKPITVINKQVKEISSTSLHKRLPVSDSADELQTLSISLNNMFDRLEYSFERQKEFIGNASHELKSPLTILMLGQEKMLSEELPEHIQSNLEKQLNTTRRVSKLVRNLLEISRLEQHESYHETEIDLKETVLALVEEFDALLTEQSIEVTCELEDITLRADHEKISQVLINLIDNAIKYNLPEKGRIKLQLYRQKSQVILKIANTGAPIPQDSIGRIFDQFYRVEKSRSTESGGAGLGLTIVRQIIELHGGTIEVANSASGMIVFTVSLPT